MSKTLYCGIKKPRKNQRQGTMKECIEANQLRLWGLNKVDKKLVALSNAPKKSQEIKKLEKKQNKLYAKINKIKSEAEPLKKHPEPTKKMTNRLNELREEVKPLVEEYNLLARQINALRSSSKKEIKEVKTILKKQVDSQTKKIIDHHFDEIMEDMKKTKQKKMGKGYGGYILFDLV